MMTMTRRVAGVFLVAAWGCSGGETSSSSHWVKCTALAECAMVSGAAACEQGFCVDVNHRPLDTSSQGGANADAGANADTGTNAETGSPMACNPLAPHELPIALRSLLGAGKDSAGTVYVVDQDASIGISSAHLFVSTGDTLYRQRITGTENTNLLDGTEYIILVRRRHGPAKRAHRTSRRGHDLDGRGHLRQRRHR